jgi:hypothetical protein
MFNNGFYPTPRHVVDLMVKPYASEMHKWAVLEPSAGKGDILDAIAENPKERWNNPYKVPRKHVYAIEIEPELVYILQEKGYRVISNDFLTFENRYHFDLILMNPPFSNGDEHLLKAWEVLESGHICCLLNAETINNPCTRTRELLGKIIADNGAAEYLGDCFRTAERRTGVNVALVRLEKTSGKTRFDFGFAKGGRVDISGEIQAGNEIALNDKLGAYIRAYEKTCGSFIGYLKAREEVKLFAGSFLDKDNLQNLIATAEKEPGLTSQYNSFVDELKRHAWFEILAKLDIEKYLTNGIRQNFNSFKENQGAMELSRENIRQFIIFLAQNRGAIMDTAITDVFDTFTKFYEENRCHVEGWKTNSQWKVNRKVILPWYIEMSYSSHYSINHRKWDEFADIDKVMCYITGKQYPDYSKRDESGGIVLLKDAISRVRIGDSSLHESEFFSFRCYKKGTLHLYFRDEWLWAEFNQRACKGKNWLGA